MTRTLTPRTLRRAVLAALLLGAATFSATTTPVTEAASAANCIYYNNAAHSTIVGKFGKDCCNNHLAWGVKTAYSTCSDACIICTPPPQN